MMKQKSLLTSLIFLSFIFSACNPQGDEQDSNTLPDEQVIVDPVEPEEPPLPEVPTEPTDPSLPTIVSMSFNKSAYGFYSDEPQSVFGTISKGTADRVRLLIDGEEHETVEVINKKFQFDLEFFDPTMGYLTFEAVDPQDELLGVSKIFYQVVNRPGPIPPISEDERTRFDLAAPAAATSKKITLWATSYWLPQVDDKGTGFALRNMSGNPLGPYLTRREWCDAAMEGSIQVRDAGGELTTYNYAGTSSSHQVDCGPYFSHSPSHKVKFRVARGEYGDGVKNYKLVPHRSIAVDPTYYPYGSVVFIPSAVGNRITLDNGDEIIHDGYYYAVDTGGLIKTNHIDVFRGTDERITQSWIKSSSSGTFSAYIVNDPEVKAFMERIHN